MEYLKAYKHSGASWGDNPLVLRSTYEHPIMVRTSEKHMKDKSYRKASQKHVQKNLDEHRRDH